MHDLAEFCKILLKEPAQPNDPPQRKVNILIRVECEVFRNDASDESVGHRNKRQESDS